MRILFVQAGVMKNTRLAKKLSNANDKSVGMRKVHVRSEVEDEEGIQDISLHPLKKLWLVDLGSNTGTEVLLKHMVDLFLKYRSHLVLQSTDHVTFIRLQLCTG